MTVRVINAEDTETRTCGNNAVLLKAFNTVQNSISSQTRRRLLYADYRPSRNDLLNICIQFVKLLKEFTYLRNVRVCKDQKILTMQIWI